MGLFSKSKQKVKGSVFGPYTVGKKGGPFRSLLGDAIGLAGSAVGSYIGGPVGGSIGGALGNTVGDVVFGAGDSGLSQAGSYIGDAASFYSGRGYSSPNRTVAAPYPHSRPHNGPYEARMPPPRPQRARRGFTSGFWEGMRYGLYP